MLFVTTPATSHVVVVRAIAVANVAKVEGDVPCGGGAAGEGRRPKSFAQHPRELACRIFSTEINYSK